MHELILGNQIADLFLSFPFRTRQLFEPSIVLLLFDFHTWHGFIIKEKPRQTRRRVFFKSGYDAREFEMDRRHQ